MTERMEAPEINLVERRSILAGYAMRVLRHQRLFNDYANVDSNLRVMPGLIAKQRDRAALLVPHVAGFHILRSLALAWRQQHSLFVPEPIVKGADSLYEATSLLLSHLDLDLRAGNLDLERTLLANTAPSRPDATEGVDGFLAATWRASGRLFLRGEYQLYGPAPAVAYEAPLSMMHGGAIHLQALIHDLSEIHTRIGQG